VICWQYGALAAGAIGTDGAGCAFFSDIVARHDWFLAGRQRSLGGMDRNIADALMAVVPPLLHALETLNFAARHIDPRSIDSLIAAVATQDERLRAAATPWPATIAPIGAILDAARVEALAAFDELRAAGEREDLRGIYRALRHLPRANEALFPLAAGLAPVNRHFLPIALRADSQTQERSMGPRTRNDVGVLHADHEPGSRGGFSMYVPEHYSPETPLPLVMALHGGSGNGRDFLWTWIREARGYGAIVIAPTAIGPTWSISGEDHDTPRLLQILDTVQTRWSIDPKRLLLTGMSDGGTFCYASGLEPGSPFTHLAPIAASFHPMLAAAADPDRLMGLPIFLTHGVRDWMFPIEIARGANAALTSAGAAVVYREIDDLSHTYPSEINAEVLAWMSGSLDGGKGNSEPARRISHRA
jgi:phospholipase/carboxylesterase